MVVARSHKVSGNGSCSNTAPAQDSSASNGISAKETRTTDGDTRRQVMHLLLTLGPVTASRLGDHLGLSAAGVRRHLDILVEDGLTETVQRRPLGQSRGRPAKHFRITDRGRANFGHSYDSLASDALDALREAGGSDAVREFARQRVRRILDRITPASSLDDVGEDAVEKTAEQLAEALNEHGYVSTVRPSESGIQVCQHHCPIAHVAAEHPELCEAEHEVITSLLSHHVQPLATIAEGHGICTTNIPLTQSPTMMKGAGHDSGTT